MGQVQILKLKYHANDTDYDNVTYFSKTLIYFAEEGIPKTSNKNITSHIR